MKTFTIFGASDDLIETSGIPGCDEFDRYSRFNFRECFILNSNEGRMRILAFYGFFDAIWCFAPCQINEDTPLPQWPIRMHSDEPGREYTVVLEIDVPDDTVLEIEERTITQREARNL